MIIAVINTTADQKPLRPLYFVPVLAVLCLVPIGFISAQTDTIPSWVKGIAGFWAEDNISDAEFIGAIEFLIDSGIITVDQQDEDNHDILKLEKIIDRNNRHIQNLKDTINEKDELIQELQSEVDEKDNHLQEQKVTTNAPEHALNSNTQTNTNSDNSEYTTEPAWKKGGHITTRNQNYTLGDIIHITGNTDFPEQRNLKGEIIHHDRYGLRVVIGGISKTSLTSEINCSNDGQTSFSCYPYGSDGFTLNLVKYNDDGTFLIEAKVEENAIAGKYELVLVYNWHGSGGPIIKSWKHFSIIPPN